MAGGGQGGTAETVQGSQPSGQGAEGLFNREKELGFSVFDPRDGKPIAHFNTEAEAKAYIADKPRLDYGPSAEDELYKPIWYLKSERLIGEKMRGPMPAGDVQKMLLAGGVKPDEMKWTGLDDFLWKNFDKKVTPEEVKEYLANNNLQIKEVVKGEPKPTAGITFDSVANEEYGKPYDQLTDQQKGVVKKVFDDTLDDKTSNSPTKFGSYVLPGGESYREMLLTLPVQKVMEPAADIREMEGRYYVQAGLLTKSFDTRGEAESYAEFIRRPDSIDHKNTFRSSHWDEPNVLAHVRFNDRTNLTYTPEDIKRIESKIQESMPNYGPKSWGSGATKLAVSKGLITPEEAAQYSHAKGWSNDTTGAERKLLHLEELQSDWHQKGRSQGYADSSDQIRTREDAEKRGYSVYRAASSTGGEAYFATGPDIPRGIVPNVGADTEAKMWAELLPRLQNYKWNEYKVPDAPFKKTWHEMALRRILQYASTNGYDGVSWTGGEEQAKRYDLSKQVDEVRYTKNDDGTYNVFATPKNGGSSFSLGPPVEPEKLPDIIGKELAQKIIAGEGTPHQQGDKTRYTLSGIDLEVGGSGMKGFYDKIVPDYLNKFGKKFGARVSETDLGGRKFKVVRSSDLSYKIEDNNGVRQNPDAFFETREQAQHYADELQKEEKPKTVPYLPITPEMRKSVTEEGVPLFNKEITKTPEFRSWFGESKVVDKDGEPKVLYHGTNKDFDTFDVGKSGTGLGSKAERALFFTQNPQNANRAAGVTAAGTSGEGAKILPVYLRVENPYVSELEYYNSGKIAKEISTAKELGHDGIVFPKMDYEGESGTIAVFSPEQVKSALGNSGAFDPNDPNILRNREKSSKDVEHWIGYAKNMKFDTEQEARDWTFRRKQQSDEQYGSMFGVTGPEKNKAFADSLPIRREGGKFKIGPKPAVSKERLGAEGPEGKSPAVNWTAGDLQDSGDTVDEESILTDYGDGKAAKVYRAYVDPNTLEPKLAEEEDEDEDAGTFDWTELQSTRGGSKAVPPAKILVRQNGKVEILDGNHRVKYWQEQGFDSVPAWVIDRRKGIKIKHEEGDNGNGQMRNELGREDNKVGGEGLQGDGEDNNGVHKVPRGNSTTEIVGNLERFLPVQEESRGEGESESGSLEDRIAPSAAGQESSLESNTVLERGGGESPEPVVGAARELPPTTVIPIKGNTVLAAAPVQIPVVPVIKVHTSVPSLTTTQVSVPLKTAMDVTPVVTRRVLSRKEIMAMAAGLNPQRQVKNVRELMKEASQRNPTKIVP